MAFIKAAEHSNINHMLKCADRYPKLRELVNISDPLLFTTPNFWKLKDHALQLAREGITQEAKELNNSTVPPTDPQYMNKKQNLLTKLNRLYPGNANAIGAVEDDEGNIHTDIAGILATITTHWQKPS